VAEALPRQRELGQTWGMAFSLWLLGGVARDRGDLATAATCYGEAVAIAARSGDQTLFSVGLLGMAVVALQAGQPEQAARLLGAAEARRDAAGAWTYASARGGDRLTVEAVRAALGPDRFVALLAAGRALSWEAAAGEARAVTEALAADANAAGGEPHVV
jgi:hypothetical protein